MTEKSRPKLARRQKTTTERLTDTMRQLTKAREMQVAIQQKIKGLEETIRVLEARRQQEILQEYGMSLSDLETFLADNKDKLRG